MTNARRILLPLIVAAAAGVSAEVAPASTPAADAHADVGVRMAARPLRRRGLQQNRKRARVAQLACSIATLGEPDFGW